MKRNLKNLYITGLLLSSTTLMAQSNLFFGIDYLNYKPSATTTGTYDIGATTYNYADETQNASGLNYKVGYITDSFRVTLSGGEKFSSSTTDYSSYGLSFDYLFPQMEVMTDEGVNPYIGLKYGMGTVDDEIAGDFDVNEYGVQAGLIFVNKSPYQLEFGVAYTMFDESSTFTNKSGTYQGNSFTNATGSLELDKALSFFVGLNYKF